MGNPMTPPSVGCARTRLVLVDLPPEGSGLAVPTWVTVQAYAALSDQTGSSVVSLGPGRFEDGVADHLAQTAAIIVNRTLGEIDIPEHIFRVSVKNLSAASSCGRGMSVAGFSADLAVAIAMLASVLGLSVPEHLIATGAWASSGGEVAMVEALRAKVRAINDLYQPVRLLHPDPDACRSLANLTPKAYDEARTAIAEIGDEVEPVAVRDWSDVVRAAFDEYQLVDHALKKGWWS